MIAKEIPFEEDFDEERRTYPTFEVDWSALAV